MTYWFFVFQERLESLLIFFVTEPFVLKFCWPYHDLKKEKNGRLFSWTSSQKPEISQESGHSIYFRTVSSQQLFWALLNWFIGHLVRATCILYLISATPSTKILKFMSTARPWDTWPLGARPLADTQFWIGSKKN